MRVVDDIIRLTKEIFPHVPEDQWKEVGDDSGVTMVVAQLDDQVRLTFAISKTRTAVRLTSGTNDVLSSTVLSNSVKSDFIGWFSLVRAKWEACRQRYFRVAKRHGFFNTRTGKPFRFLVGSHVEVRSDGLGIRWKDYPEKPWVELDPRDTKSSIHRAKELGVLVPE